MTDCKGIKLNKGKVSMVDIADYEWLNQWKWHVTDKGYACRTISNAGLSTSKSMHRLIMSPPKGLYVDHIDGNGLNNRRENLRICTHDDNCRNRKLSKNCTSKFKGVTWHKASGKWQARVKYNRKTYHLGLYENETDAAHAYNQFAKEKFGEYTLPNPVPDDWVITTRNKPVGSNNVREGKRKLNATSKYKGVARQHKRWRAAIKTDGKLRYLGVFDNEDDAALAYNEAAKAAWGDDAYLNIINSDIRRRGSE